MRLDRWSDFATYNIAILAPQQVREESVENAMETINRAGAAAFVEHNPNFYPCEGNSSLINGVLGDAPRTRLNLELACRELGDKLESQPPPEDIPIDNWVSVIRTSDQQLEHWVPSDEERAQLAKLADDPNLNDHQRKVRLKKLALLAGEQRRALSNLPGRPTPQHPSGSDPKIVI